MNTYPGGESRSVAPSSVLESFFVFLPSHLCNARWNVGHVTLAVQQPHTPRPVPILACNMDETEALERDILFVLNVICCKDGCDKMKETTFWRTSHNQTDAGSIKIDSCAAGHIYSVCPRYRCRLLNADRTKKEKNKEWINDCNTETKGQKILWCVSCRFENSVIMACQSCFDAAGKKVALEDLCDSCLMKTCFDSTNEQTYLQELRNFCSSKDSLDTRFGNRWIFRKTSKNSKGTKDHLFEQCRPVSVSKDGKYVTVRRLSDNEVILLLTSNTIPKKKGIILMARVRVDDFIRKLI